MANIKSQIKRNRQNEKRRLRNRDARGTARAAVKDARASLATAQGSQAAVTAAISALDRAARRGAIHHRNAARLKGRLMKRLAGMAPQSAEAAHVPAESAAAKPKKTSRPAAEAKAKSTAGKKTTAKKTTKK